MGETFYYAAPEPNDFFEIDLCGITPPNPRYEVYRSDSPIYVIEYVNAGKGWLDIGGGHYEVKAGDFYFLRKGASGRYYADREEPFDKIWINFRGKLIDDIISVYCASENVIIRPQNDTRIRDMIQGIHARLRDITDETSAEVLRACSVDVIAILSIAMRHETLDRGFLPATTAEKIKRYIDMQLCEDLSLAGIAQVFHIHEVYAIRLFRERYGVTPMKYLSTRRIDLARRMIAEGQLSFKEIAAALRFADGPYFSSRFKKETGMSPSEYREWLKENKP